MFPSEELVRGAPGCSRLAARADIGYTALVTTHREAGSVKIEDWNVIDEDRAILWREYSYAKGARATTLVFRGEDGLVVVSPGVKTSARAFDALAELGPVRALIANNRFHHLGQREWRARFPDAESYCPPGAVATLAKRAAGIPFRPLSELTLPRYAHAAPAPGFRSGEALMSVDSKHGAVWYTGDLVINLLKAPPPPLGWLFTMTGSAPGLRLFKPATWVLVNDKKELRSWMLAQLDEHPPGFVVPGHGPAIGASDLAEQTRAQIRRL